MDIKKLLYFKTIVEQGQISRAARVLNMSQPPLSQRLKEMEEELATTLILRSGNNWAVTRSGQILYQKALQILDMVEDIPIEIKQTKKTIQGMVKIGCTTMAFSAIQRFFPLFYRRQKGITFRLFTGDSTILHRMLQERVLDFCVMLSPDSSAGYDADITALPDSRLCAVIPHALASASQLDIRKKKIDLSVLSRLPLILPRRFEGGGVYQKILDVFALQSVVPNIFMDCPDCTTTLRLLDVQSDFAAIVPFSEVSSQAFENNQVYDLPDAFPRIKPCIVSLKGRYLSRAAVMALEGLKKSINSKQDHS